MTELLHALLKNRYQLGDVLGQGGMATVYQGHDTSLGRDVAIKLFPINSDESELQKQEDEVNVLAGLNHHGLVTLLDAGVDRGRDGNRVFLVMELIQGSDLQKTIAEGPLVPRQIAQIGYDLAEALQYVHHQGVVHRDVKPSNVHFVDYADDSTRARVKLTDFGIAHRGVERLASDSVTTGTAAYLSPEQVTRGEVGPQTDIYSLGLVLLECFTGVVAFPGSAMESAAARVERDPFIPEDIGAEWRMLLTAMTSRDPYLRPDRQRSRARAAVTHCERDRASFRLRDSAPGVTGLRAHRRPARSTSPRFSTLQKKTPSTASPRWRREFSRPRSPS